MSRSSGERSDLLICLDAWSSVPTLLGNLPNDRSLGPARRRGGAWDTGDHGSGTAPSSRSLGVALVAAGPVAASPAAGAAPGTVRGVVRLDQVGYAIGEAKRAYLMAEAPADTARFAVVDAAGRTVLSGRVGRRTGGWNGRYPAVHRIDFGALRRPGRYRIVVDGVAAPHRRSGSRPATTCSGTLADDTVHFFQVQRDGAHVPRRLDRKPSHLTDRHATVYATPVFEGDGGDVPAAPLKPVGGPVDVEGGWFDAGDFVKFTHATAYSVAELLLVQRGLHPRTMPWPPRPATACGGWTRSGTSATGSCTPRSGWAPGASGSGSSATTTCGDCPRPTTRYGCAPATPSTSSSTARCSAPPPPGARISPNLAGRVAAAFALGAQVEARATTSGRGHCCEPRPRSSPWPGPPASASS